MKKDSQKPSVADSGLATPDRVSVAMAEVAEDMQAGLLVGLHQRGPDVTLPVLVGDRRVDGTARGGDRGVRPPGHPTVSVAQDQKRGRPPTAELSGHRGPEDDAGLPRRLGD